MLKLAITVLANGNVGSRSLKDLEADALGLFTVSKQY